MAFPRGLLQGNRTATLVRTAIKFGLVGLTGFAVNSAVLTVLYRGAEFPLWLSSILAVECAITSNYLLNDRWTFSRKRPSWRRFGKFNLSSAAALAATPPVVWLATSVQVSLLVANICGVLAGAGANFTTSSLWVWRISGGGANPWERLSSSAQSPPCRSS